MSRVYCGDCEKSYARMARWKEHFELQEVTQDERGGKLIPNPCYKRKRKVYGMTLEEARSNKKQTTMTQLMTKNEKVEVEAAAPEAEGMQQPEQRVEGNELSAENSQETNSGNLEDTKRIKDIYTIVHAMDVKIENLIQMKHQMTKVMVKMIMVQMIKKLLMTYHVFLFSRKTSY